MIQEPVMSEVILQIDDAIPFEQIVNVLAPYIKNAELKQINSESKCRIWDGKAEWLQNPIMIDGFTPLSRDEAHAR
jgi:hypothetical protein